MKKKILLIDDDIELCEEVAEILEDVNYDVEKVYIGTEGQTLAQQQDYDVILLDLKIPGDGFKILEKLKREKPERRILVVTANPIAKEELFSELEELGRINQLSRLIADFLNLYKSCGKSIEEITNRVSANDSRTRKFLKIFSALYEDYMSYLKKTGEIDFNDMLNKATKIIQSEEYTSNFKYILVDEFQWSTTRAVRGCVHGLCGLDPHGQGELTTACSGRRCAPPLMHNVRQGESYVLDRSKTGELKKLYNRPFGDRRVAISLRGSPR